MREVQANKNIIANRRRALDTILKLNTTHGYSSNMLIQHNFNKNTVPPIWGVIHTLSLGDVLTLSDYSSPQAVRDTPSIHVLVCQKGHHYHYLYQT